MNFNVDIAAKDRFIAHFLKELEAHTKHNRRSVSKLAATYGLTDKTVVKEFTELAIVLRARMLARSASSRQSMYTRFLDVLNLYEHQVNISHRTSHSMLLQQYSTPAPIGFVAGMFCNVEEPVSVFEPSAGNGLLTILADPARVTVNEVDLLRNSNLHGQGFRQVMNQDATEPFTGLLKSFDAVITNPPFGILSRPVLYDTFRIKLLDHLMALRALDTMRDDGKAAIIVASHTRWDRKGRIQAGKNRIFFNYLYSRYHVEDVINIDGKKMYSRQGTTMDVRLILISGRKARPSGAAPNKTEHLARVVSSYEELFERVSAVTHPRKQTDINALEHEAAELTAMLQDGDELGIPYSPASDSCVILNTVVPDSMGYETHAALERIKDAVGGDIDEYVREKLGYPSKIELCKALSAEQIDAVAMSIYNIEERGQGMIIGDQTGIGKGRIAAAVIRYGVQHGHKPVFITEKANLFSDIYRDLSAIGSDKLVPFIVNGRESKTDIKDEDGEVVYQALPPAEQQAIFESGVVPVTYDFVVATYSQFNSPEKKPVKPSFLKSIIEDNIIIMDEAHNSSGSGNTGSLMQDVVSRSKGCVFLSATFAKRPDNMPIYAMKTAIQEASMSRDALVEAISRGGVALQEILASQLVAEGQMIRRERSFEGVEVNYITLEDKEEEHRAISDNITEIIRDIINFQTTYVDPMVAELDDIAAQDSKQVNLREGTSEAGVDNMPYFSKVFNVINQMLFSIKAEAVAERAIQRLREGKKPVIAFASTMGSFIEQMATESGQPVSDGDVVNADFSLVLQKGLDGVMRYTETDIDGKRIYKQFEITDFSLEGQIEYHRIQNRITEASTGITISPIDVIIKKITADGYTVAEVTGRKYELQLNGNGKAAIVRTRKKVNTNDAFRQFNNNEVDVLMINQSGSTGASAHAIITPRVPKEQVKQRVMIVLQAELDINTEVQKRGRINRTGQIYKPIYDYVNSAIPAEKRLMMMLQKKLKSLDANTTSNQKSSTKILDVPDFLNKYGDRVVAEYLKENQEVNRLLDDPLGTSFREVDAIELEDAAHRVSGRVAVLSTVMQQDFYNEIALRYDEHINYLKQVGEYDLEVEAMDLQAEVLSSQVAIVGKGGGSSFGEDSVMETVMANVLKKPFSKEELDNLLKESLQGRTADEITEEMISTYEMFVSAQQEQDLMANDKGYQTILDDLTSDTKLLRVLQKSGEEEYQKLLTTKKAEYEAAREANKDKIKKMYEHRKMYILSMFKIFQIGRPIAYPITTFENGQALVLGVFLGFILDTKKKNPYTPSNIRLRFAIANSNKYIALPASYVKDVQAIIGASVNTPKWDRDTLLNRWEAVIKEGSADRKIRHIITGNVLQAFGAFQGKLVSYTTLDGAIRKGILMAEYWEPSKGTQVRTVVPLGRAVKIIQSLIIGASATTRNGVSFFRQAGGFKIMVAAAKSRGGDFYLDPDVLALVERNNFEKVSDKMVALLRDEKIKDFTNILQTKFNDTLALTPQQYELIRNDLPDRTAKATPLPVKAKTSSTYELELEAMALELELELLNFAA